MPAPSLTAIFPSLPRATRGNPIVIGTTPDGEKILYCNGNFVYTVPIDDLKSAEIYAEHKTETTVAKISPSGFYCASGDVQGNVRIWDTTQSTHILKMETKPLTGAIRDIAWCSESKRLAVVGEGSQRFGHVFLFDTGSSNGSLEGVSARLNTVDFKPTRPFRVVAGGDSKELALFVGPPFKLKNTTEFREIHENYIYSARYSPDGKLVASCGGDKKVVLYDASNEKMIGTFAEFNGLAHNGSVYGLAWSPDGKRLATASADKTVIIWDVATRSVLQNVTFPPDSQDNQQLAVVWTKKGLLSVSASGAINKLDPENGQILSVRQGHNKGITRLAKSFDGKELFSSDVEGNITTWNVSTGATTRVSLHSSMITGLSCTLLGELTTVGWDDRLLISSPGEQPKSFKLFAQPTDLAVSTDGSFAVAVCHKVIAVLIDGHKLTEVEIDFESSGVALSPDNQHIAVGDKKERVIIYSFDGDKLEETFRLDVVGNATSISFSPNGDFMTATTHTGKVILFDAVRNFNLLSPSIWSSHNGKALCSAWSPDSNRFATGSLDRQIIIWDLKKKTEEPFKIKNAHPSDVNALVWIDETTLVSGGQDANIKFWNVPV